MKETELQIANKTKHKQQDFSHTARTTSGLVPYSGPWTLAEVKHLLRRAMFGAPKADVDYFVAQGMAATISELLTAAPTPAPPIYTYTAVYADPNVPQGQTWVNSTFDPLATGSRTKSYKAWLASLMLNQNRSITEKMTLFWSNHFSTELTTIQDPRLAYFTNVLCRQYALGNFKDLTKLITLDAGMLKYLNGYLNTVTAPDENYGRELQELFTVGKDANGNPYYNQNDVIAASHVLTGWRIDSPTCTSYFTDTRHDPSDKTFSAFYNNTVITGQTGAAGANEIDDLLNMIFAANEVSLNICRKLYRFFVYYEIDANVELDVIQPLATIFRNNNYEILPVLTALLNSEHFFDVLNRGCIIKAPVDTVIAFLRDFNVDFPTSANIIDQYVIWFKVSQHTALLNQSLHDPPNVAGWPAYYQAPQFHELWINTNTLPNRNQFTDIMFTNGITVSGVNILADVIAYTTTLTTPDDPDLLIQEVIDRHYSEDVSQVLKDYLKSILLNGQLTNSYWTVAWTDFTGNPGNASYRQIVLTRLRAMFIYLMDLSEYQLS